MRPTGVIFPAFKTFFLSLLASVLLVNGGPAHAATALLDPQGDGGEPAAPQDPGPQIEADSGPESDTAIRSRIEGIFGAIPALEAVTVSVDQGVVQLSGTVEDVEARDRAETIAGRVSGVVTVENAIERDVSLDGSRTLQSLGDRVAKFRAMLPLIALAALAFGIIVLLGYLLAAFRPLWRRIAPNAFLATILASAVRFLAVVIGLVVALDILGAGALMGAVLGGAGILGIALGFAMRDTIETYVASLLLSLRQPFRANDHVLIGEHEGRVIRLTSRATVLMTLDGNHLRIPNAEVFRATILNYSRNPLRRFDFVLGVDADDDAVAARRLGVRVLGELPFVKADPPPEARIEEVGDSSVVIRFLAWIDQTEADFRKSRTRAIPAVKVALEDAGFGLPEPIYRLRFDPRSATLPFHNVTVNETAPEPAPRQAPAPEKSDSPPSARREADDHDVRPDTDIVQMVEEERRTSGDPDLLDPDRPVE
jgi:small-conductance mechanosensitive channel